MTTQVAPVLADLDHAIDRPLPVRVRVWALESAQRQCRADLDALLKRMFLSGPTPQIEAQRAGIVHAYDAVLRELRALGVEA